MDLTRPVPIVHVGGVATTVVLVAVVQYQGKEALSMEMTRQHVVEVLRRAGLSEEADQAELWLPESADVNHVLELCLAHGITKDRLISLLGGSP